MNARGTKPAKFKNIARAVTAIAVLSVGVPLYGHDLLSSAAHSIESAGQNRAAKNTPPSARADFVNLNKAASAFNVLANDHDADGDRLIVIEANAEFGAVAFTPEGLLAYAQEAGMSRSDKIIYTVSDGRGGIDTGLVQVSAR